MSLRRQLLEELYGAAAEQIADRLDDLVSAAVRSPAGPRWSQADAWLIAYPDQFGPSGLQGVGEVIDALAPSLNGVHVLPFHPSSSDGGFSVEDHAVVDPAVGDWDDVAALARHHRLMADAVVNHVSAQGTWFRAHLAGEPEHADFFRVVPAGTDLSAVVRPRPGPPITAFTRADGTTADYWTTFSADQVDLDYRSPEVLLAVCDAVIRYASTGAAAIRLDAVAFVAKDPATASVHLDDTHRIVALIRDCLDEIDPGIMLVTETNVAHRDNVAYLGTPSRPEAHAIYQFTLAPLVLHALHTGDAAPLTRWAAGWDPPPGTTVLNFLASHDGVGLRPAAGSLDSAQIEGLAARCREAGGEVNEAATPSGTEPYELAATWRSLCSVGEAAPFADDVLADRIVATHAIAFALAGVPLVYVHSPAATPNDHARAGASGITRDLNRTRFPSPADYLDRLAHDPVGGRVWPRLAAMLAWRRRSRAFHPDASQRILEMPPGVVAVARGEDDDEVRVVVNLARREQRVEIGAGWRRMDDGRRVDPTVEMAPWQVVWVERDPV